MKNQSVVARFAHKISIQRNGADNELAEAAWEEFVTCFAQVKPVCDNKFVSLEGVAFGDIILAATPRDGFRMVSNNFC